MYQGKNNPSQVGFAIMDMPNYRLTQVKFFELDRYMNKVHGYKGADKFSRIVKND